MKIINLIIFLLVGSNALLGMEADWQAPLQKIKPELLDRLFLKAVYINRPIYEIEYLLARGADLNAQDPDGSTALHLAANKGHEQVFRMLMKKGCLIKANKHGKKVQEVAHPSMEAALIEEFANRLLLDSAKNGDIEAIEHALRMGADKNMRDSRGFTAFHIAAFSDVIECMEYLYALNPAYVLDKDFKGHDALYWAIKMGNFESIEWFIDNFPDRINNLENRYDRALFWAAIRGEVEVVDWLIEDYPYLGEYIEDNLELALRYIYLRGNHEPIVEWLSEKFPHIVNAESTKYVA